MDDTRASANPVGHAWLSDPHAQHTGRFIFRRTRIFEGFRARILLHPYLTLGLTCI